MLINVSYFAQAAAAIGIDCEEIEADDLRTLVRAIHERHADAAVGQVCDEHGALVPWVLVDVDGQLVKDPAHRLQADARVRFLSPISGG